MSKKRTTSLIASSLALAVSGYTGAVGAAGFALIEQSGSGTGNAFAGGAASAEDASTIFFNPAGLTRLTGRQVVLGIHAIKPSAEFSNQGSAAPLLKPLGTDGGDAGQWGVVPNFYLSWAANDRLSLGLGVNAPFGLRTSYDSNWIGRYQALDSEVKTVNINPAFAFKINDVISIGAGLNYQTIDATLTRAVNFGPGGEGSAKVSGDASAWGWNVGALFNLGTDMRVGGAYRSQLKYHIEGDVTFNRPPGVPAGAAPDGGIFTDITVPESASLSVFQKFNEKWDFMGDITWTRWSRLENLNIYRTGGGTLQLTPENWDDTWRFSLGLSYHVDERWTLRGGVAFDQTPVSDQFRTARIPDQDRTWLAIGAQWKPTPAIAIDIGYAHLFVKDATINDNQGTGVLGNGLLQGTYSNSVDIFSLQMAYSF